MKGMDDYYRSRRQKFDRSKDVLKLVYLVSFRLGQSKIVKTAQVLSVLFQTSISCVQIYDILATFNGLVLVKYGPTLFAFMDGLFVTSVQCYSIEKMALIVHNMFEEMWSLDSINPAIAKKISIEARVVTCVIVVDLILGMCFVGLLALNTDMLRNLFYGVLLFDTKLSKPVSTYLICVYILTLLALFGTMLTVPYFCTYMIIYQKFQVYILNDLLSNISKDYQNYQDSTLIHDQVYQYKIRQRLKVCVQRHQFLKRTVKELNDFLYIPLNITMVMVLITYISMAYYAVVMEVTTVTLIGVTFILLCSFTASSLFFYSGQSLINESEKLNKNVWNCPWTSWNLENRKIFLTIYLNCHKSLMIGNDGTFMCQYPFITKALNFMISTVMFFREMTI